MGLIHPGPSWAHWSDNLGSTPSSDGVTFGTGVTAAANNTDGSAVTLLSALAHDCEYLVLGFSGFGLSGANSSALLDVLIDPAGGTNWSERIADLLAGYTHPFDWDSGSAGIGIPRIYHFPLWIPAGASIGARARCAHTANITGRVVAYAAGGNRNPASWWCGQKVETVGSFNASASIGQSHTPGASGVYSSWANLGSALSAEAGAVQWAVQGEMDPSVTGRVYHFEFGAGSNPVGPRLLFGVTGAESSTQLLPGPVFAQLASGTQLQVRATAGGASPQPLDCAAYVVQ